MMDFFEAVSFRRSVRKYSAEPVPEDVIEKALDAALLAPNSSNMQTWEFYWVRSPEKKEKLIQACLNQSAARTAQELIVIVSDRSLWKRNNSELLSWHLKDSNTAHMVDYYKRLMPFLYGWTILSPLKWLVFNGVGLFRPLMRRPWSPRDLDEVSLKSAALASENLMLALAAQGYDSCPMEGMDESRIRKILNLGCKARVVMVVSVGKRVPRGIWGERKRLPKEWFIKKI